uniref:Proliferating cell nuclear antigen PCNA N-terminal domain-containing protein n=1 Tax=viral metagenome TaxID=1070528 RepID=A0A6C0IVC8_9ZZZZ
MFSLRHSNPFILLKYFKCIEDITDTLNINVNTDGIHINSMDQSHVSYIDGFLDKDDFDEYNVEKDVIVGLNLKSFCKILNAYDKDDCIILDMDKSEDKISITFENENRKSQFELKLLLIEQDDLKIDSMDYDQEIDISFNRLETICNEMDIIETETIKFYINKDSKDIKLYGEGHLGILNLLLKENNENKERLMMKKKGNKLVINKKLDYKLYPIKKSFDIEFNLKKIKSILKLNAISNSILINLSEDYPTKLECQIEENSYLHYYIAPKIIE